MFKNTFINGIVSLFYSLGTQPLQLWAKHVNESSSSRISFVIDEVLSSNVLELACEAENLPTTFVRCPPENAVPNTLCIKLPILTAQLRNMNALTSMEVEIMDSSNSLRRFRAANWIVTASVTNEITLLPLQLSEEWNSVCLDLQLLCNKVYGSNFVSLESVQIHGTCRIRRVFMSKQFVAESELPVELQLFAPSPAAQT